MSRKSSPAKKFDRAYCTHRSTLGLSRGWRTRAGSSLHRLHYSGELGDTAAGGAGGAHQGVVFLLPGAPGLEDGQLLDDRHSLPTAELVAVFLPRKVGQDVDNA